MIKREDKKAAEMTIGTVIVIILSLVVLIFLIYSFSKSGGSLMDNLKNYFGGGANVDTVVRACQAACATKSVYDYSQMPRDVKFDTTYKTSLKCIDLQKEVVFNSTKQYDPACTLNCKRFPAPITEPCSELS